MTGTDQCPRWKIIGRAEVESSDEILVLEQKIRKRISITARGEKNRALILAKDNASSFAGRITLTSARNSAIDVESKDPQTTTCLQQRDRITAAVVWEFLVSASQQKSRSRQTVSVEVGRRRRGRRKTAS